VKRLAPLLALLLALIAAPAAEAADPTMPLSDVQSGMHCTGLTVVRGTEISFFKADVIDVVEDGSTPGPAILVRVYGPAVDESGIAEGFSGAPVYCDRGDGVDRVVGAIAYGLGDYGNKLGLVTPIDAILGQPVTPPSNARRLTRRQRRSVHPLASPLTIAGLSPRLGQRISEAARSRGRSVYAVPAGPLGSFPPQQLVPGASLAAGLSSGDTAISAIGTVTYTRGSSVWGFGHPMDFGGRRALLLQDAYVYTVVSNPNGDIGVSYKLAAAGHDLGTLSGDMLFGVTGTVGPQPPTTALTVHAADLDTGRARTSHTRVADEIALGPPTESSPLRIVAPIALLDTTDRLLESDPSRETARMCLRATVAGHAHPLAFCNRYVGDNSLIGNGSLLAAFDTDSAVGLLDTAQIGGLRVTSMSADLELGRGLAQAYVTHVAGPRKLRAGRDIDLTVRVKVVKGGPRTFAVHVPLPDHLRPGRYALTVSGPGPDGTGSGGGGGGLSGLLIDLVGGGSGGGARPGDLGATSFAKLAKEFARFHHYDGLTATLRRRGGHSHASSKRHGGPGQPALARVHAFRSREFRIGGRRVVRFRVTRS
jgi:hypothetical protein